MTKTCHVWYRIECFDKYNSFLSNQTEFDANEVKGLCLSLSNFIDCLPGDDKAGPKKQWLDFCD